MNTYLSIQESVTWFNVGLIWVVQIIVYPQFRRVGATEFRVYHSDHCLRIGFIIVPLFLTEIATACWLFFEGLHSMPFLISLAMFPVICLSTAIWQAPMHTRLANGRDDAVIRRLVLTNWVRTVAWSLRGICLCFII